MRAIAPSIDLPVDVWQSCEIIREGVQQSLLRHRGWDEPAGLPIASSGDPTFASRADEILGSDRRAFRVLPDDV